MLTKEQIFALDDITTKEITVPEHIPAWGGNKFLIKQLTRGQQDIYNKRTSGNLQMRQTHGKDQIISGISVGGNDAWLCVFGMVDEKGIRLFAEAEIEKLNKKNGDAIGWIAKQILEFSGMADDNALNVERELEYFRTTYPDVAKEYKVNHLLGLEDEVKNS